MLFFVAVGVIVVFAVVVVAVVVKDIAVVLAGVVFVVVIVVAVVLPCYAENSHTTDQTVTKQVKNNNYITASSTVRKYIHVPFFERFVWSVGFLTSSSATGLYRGRVPRLTFDDLTCCHTRDPAGRP